MANFLVIKSYIALAVGLNNKPYHGVMINPIWKICFIFFLFHSLFTGCASHPCPQKWTPGTNDTVVQDLLKRATDRISLGNTSLEDLAPKYVVEYIPGISWDDAIIKANQLFPEDQVKRSIFLSRYLPGRHVENLKELGLPNMGFSAMTGSGKSITLGLETNDSLPKNPIGGFYQPKTDVTLTFYESSDLLKHSVVLTIQDVEYKELTFTSVSFDIHSNRLIDFCLEAKVGDIDHPMSVSGNMTGKNHTNYYCATIENGTFREVISYTPGLKPLERRVYTYQTNPRKLQRMDLYINDTLSKTVDY